MSIFSDMPPAVHYQPITQDIEGFVERERIDIEVLPVDPEISRETLERVIECINRNLRRLAEGNKEPIVLNNIAYGHSAYSINQPALDFLVRHRIIHSWNITARFGICAVKLREEYHEEDHANYRLPGWRSYELISPKGKSEEL